MLPIGSALVELDQSPTTAISHWPLLIEAEGCVCVCVPRGKESGVESMAVAWADGEVKVVGYQSIRNVDPTFLFDFYRRTDRRISLCVSPELISRVSFVLFAGPPSLNFGLPTGLGGTSLNFSFQCQFRLVDRRAFAKAAHERKHIEQAQ